MNSDRDTLAGGLPHSEIPGSPIARISPGLFAACHVLHRLSVPRHPPDALPSRLITSIPVAGNAAPPPRTGPSPSSAASHEDTSLGQARARAPLAPPSGASKAGAIPTGGALLRRWATDKASLRRKGPSAACPGLSASVTSQLSLYPSINPHRGRPRQCRLILSERRARRRFSAAPWAPASLTPCRQPYRRFAGAFGVARPTPVARRNRVATVVEVNGFEPMTSCLQSRRSPS